MITTHDLKTSPLAYGLLTGKYNRAAVEAAGSRKRGFPNEGARDGSDGPTDERQLDGDNPFGDMLFTDRNWRIADEVKRIATETGETPARVALAWVIGGPGVTSTRMGVSRPGQVTENADALGHALSAGQLTALDKVSAGSESILYSLARLPPRCFCLRCGASPAPRQGRARPLLTRQVRASSAPRPTRGRGR